MHGRRGGELRREVSAHEGDAQAQNHPHTGDRWQDRGAVRRAEQLSRGDGERELYLDRVPRTEEESEGNNGSGDESESESEEGEGE